jgi:hypothetical protein
MGGSRIQVAQIWAIQPLYLDASEPTFPSLVAAIHLGHLTRMRLGSAADVPGQHLSLLPHKLGLQWCGGAVDRVKLQDSA